MLIFEALDDNEAILIEGFETYSAYSGYGRTLQFAGNFQDSMKARTHCYILFPLCSKISQVKLVCWIENKLL